MERWRELWSSSLLFVATSRAGGAPGPMLAAFGDVTRYTALSKLAEDPNARPAERMRANAGSEGAGAAA